MYMSMQIPICIETKKNKTKKQKNHTYLHSALHDDVKGIANIALFHNERSARKCTALERVGDLQSFPFGAASQHRHAL